MVLTLSERSKGSCFSYAPTSRPFRQLRKRAAFNGALLQSACARVHRRRMAYLLPLAGAAKLSGHGSGCGQRDSHCTKRLTKHSWCRAGTALLDLAASIRPKSGCSGVRSHSRTLSLCRGRFSKRSETSSGHVHCTLHLHPMRSVERTGVQGTCAARRVERLERRRFEHRHGMRKWHAWQHGRWGAAQAVVR